MKHIKNTWVVSVTLFLAIITFSCEEDKFIPDTTETALFISIGENAVPMDCNKITFDGLETGSVNVPELINAVTKGGYLWEVVENRSNRAMQMSVKASAGSVKSWLVAEIDFDRAQSFSFTSRDGFNNGNPLKVLYTTNFDKDSNIAEFAWMDVTSDFSIASNAPADAMSELAVASGDWDISSISGNGAIAFVYEGVVDGITTVMEIDNISVSKSSCVISAGSCVVANVPTSTLPIATDFEEADPQDIPFFIVTDEGIRNWSVFGDNTNQFMQASSIGSSESNKTWLISPSVDFDFYDAEILTFDSRDGYNNGEGLKVVYSSDYDGSDCPSSFTWETINAVIASGSTDGLAPEFTNSGMVDLSGLIGAGHVAFVYEGSSDGITTDMQIDNILIDGSSCENFGVDDSRVVNGGFEEFCSTNQPKGWDTVDSGIEVTQDMTIFHGGESSMKVVVSDTDKQDFYQNLQVEAGKYYKISFWVYHEDAGVKVRLVVPGWPSLYSDPSILGQWQKIEYDYNSTTTEVISLLGMRFYKSGFTGPTSTIYIDDFSAVEIQQPNIPSLTNGSFENWSGGILEDWTATSGADFTMETNTDPAFVSDGETSL